ncbi:Cation/H(+) antiporter 18 [Vitis vinifera]|uniref:Cation/H(+) antiporter 18 n=1 Tax=Vitis vinifera TaxID=29760 RepID=A0A438E659_VITVI|nr:Cation/H(+) antiporter 18 [Vitis vinifera]
MLVVVVTRCLAFLMKPLRQPRVIAEIVGGILLGPSALGRNKQYLHSIFPPKSLTVLDTLANLGLLFFLFIVGLELDLKSLHRAGKKALSIAVAGISLPFALGVGTSFVLRATISKGVDAGPFVVFMGVALSITAFPVLARILAELKLLTTDVGQMAMSAAAVNDVAAWILLALAIALSGTGRSPIISLWVWMAQRCPEGEPVDEMYICATLAAVLAAGFVTDAIGIHALFGSFVMGILVPKEGPFASALVEKVEDLVSGLLLPLYFVSSGLKTDVSTIRGLQSWSLLVLVIFTACLGKIAGTIAVSLCCRMPVREALALGFLMNSKGLVELIVLNIGKERKVLNDQTFAIMILMALFTTFITTPLVISVYKPAKRPSKADYKHRTIDRKNPNGELRILVCFRSTNNIPTMINLIEASRGTGKREGLCVYAMHLMELSERSSVISMVHKTRKNGLPFWNKGLPSGSNQVIVAFEAFGQLSSVSIRPMIAISAMSNIHEDICTSAERKRVAIIILPFHKHQRLDGTLETTRSEFSLVNRKVLERAPCSVGILVDRGLGGTAQVSASNVSSIITVPFFGGCDDAKPSHMGEAPTPDSHDNPNFLLDENFLAEFKHNSSLNSAVKFEERVVKNAAEAMEIIREYHRCTMFVVGRMPEGHVVAGLSPKTEFPELGPVGSLLTSPGFPTVASVLVVQQYQPGSFPNSEIFSEE